MYITTVNKLFDPRYLIRIVSAKMREIIFPNSYKQRTLSKRAIHRIIGRKDAVIIEIGAADGLDTAAFLAQFEDDNFRIIAIEPDRRNVNKFKNLVNDPRVTLIEAAISDKDGYADFHLSSTEYSSSLKSPNIPELQKRWPEMTFDQSISVKTRSLDSLVDEMNLPLVDFIWADVQGAEDLLVLGGKQALEMTRFLYTEYGGEDLYSDDVSLKKLTFLLGSSWSLIHDYKTDALFVNRKLTKKDNRIRSYFFSCIRCSAKSYGT